MKLRSLTALAAAISLVAAPTLAVAQQRAPATATGSARAGIDLEDPNELAAGAGTTFLLIGLGVIAIVVGSILIFDDDDDDGDPGGGVSP